MPQTPLLILMKRLLLILSFGIILSGCQNTETNDPTLQAELDSTFFKAIDARVTETEDGSFLIHGITQDETLTLRVAALQVGTYTLGGSSTNYGSFENTNGDTYFTNPNGSGRVIISNWDTEQKTLTGTFNFDAIIQGVDTLTVHNGIFFEAPIRALDDPDTIDPSTNAGTFVAHIDDNPFNPFNVSAVETTDSIIITGSTTNRSIVIKVPKDIEAGNVTLPAPSINLQYIDGDGTQSAITGNLIIFAHELGIKNIKGTFYFQAATKTISLGQFNVRYE